MEGPCDQKNGVAEEHMTYSKTETSTRGKKTKEEEPIATRKGFLEKRTPIDLFNELSITDRSMNFPNDQPLPSVQDSALNRYIPVSGPRHTYKTLNSMLSS